MSLSPPEPNWPDGPGSKSEESEKDTSHDRNEQPLKERGRDWGASVRVKEGYLRQKYEFDPMLIEKILQARKSTILSGSESVNESFEDGELEIEELIASVAKDAVIAPMFRAVSISGLGISLVMALYALMAGVYWLIPVFLAGILFFGYAYIDGYD